MVVCYLTIDQLVINERTKDWLLNILTLELRELQQAPYPRSAVTQ
jgi:hypothetical protein